MLFSFKIIIKMYSIVFIIILWLYKYLIKCSEKAMAPHSSTLAWKIRVAKSWTWLSDFTFTFHFHALEKKMATHSSVLVWRIPGTGEPVGLLSLGSHRVRHNWSDLAAAAAVIKCFYHNSSFLNFYLILLFCPFCFIFYWSMVDLQCCISSVKQSSKYTYITT